MKDLETRVEDLERDLNKMKDWMDQASETINKLLHVVKLLSKQNK